MTSFLTALLVTKWLHTIEMVASTGGEPEPEEAQLMSLIKDALEEADYDFSESNSLAAGLARAWSSFLQDVRSSLYTVLIPSPLLPFAPSKVSGKLADGFNVQVWVWGISPRMGMILQKLATEYERLLEHVR